MHAVGDCPADQEHEFADALAKVLAQFGATESQLGGEKVNGPVHTLKPAKKSQD
jgi:hypothetical protein